MNRTSRALIGAAMIASTKAVGSFADPPTYTQLPGPSSLGTALASIQLDTRMPLQFAERRILATGPILPPDPVATEECERFFDAPPAFKSGRRFEVAPRGKAEVLPEWLNQGTGVFISGPLSNGRGGATLGEYGLDVPPH